MRACTRTGSCCTTLALPCLGPAPRPFIHSPPHSRDTCAGRSTVDSTTSVGCSAKERVCNHVLRSLCSPLACLPPLRLLGPPALQTSRQNLPLPLINVLVCLLDAQALRRVPGREVFGFRGILLIPPPTSIPFTFGLQHMLLRFILHASCCIYIPRLLGNKIILTPLPVCTLRPSRGLMRHAVHQLLFICERANLQWQVCNIHFRTCPNVQNRMCANVHFLTGPYLGVLVLGSKLPAHVGG